MVVAVAIFRPLLLLSLMLLIISESHIYLSNIKEIPKKRERKLRKLDDTNGKSKAIPSSSTTDADDDKYWMMISSNIKNTKKRERNLEN